jgi:signal peptidase
MSLKDLLHPKSEGATFVRDIILILLVVAGIGIVLFGVSGTWPALVGVESGSMEPNLPTYSLVFVVDENRFGDWMTQDEAEAADTHKVLNEYGDVIVYQPNRMKGVTPIIHRAITTVTKEEAQALGFTGDAAHSGVITKGDNEITNPYPDQFGSFPSYGISRMEPVKEEWIVGKAVFAIPLIGWVPLHIIESILIAAAVIICIEIVSRIVSKRKSRKR